MFKVAGIIFFYACAIFSLSAADSFLEYDGKSVDSREWIISKWIFPKAGAKEFFIKLSGRELRRSSHSFFQVEAWCFDKNGKSLGGFERGRLTLNGESGKWQDIGAKAILPSGTAKLKLCLMGVGEGKYQIAHVFFGESGSSENLVSNPGFSLENGKDKPDDWSFTQKRKDNIVWKKMICDASSAPPFIMIPNFKAPPSIDGKLDDFQQKNGAKLCDFVLLDGFSANEKTDAWLAYDHENLYIAVICHESNMKTLELSNGSQLWKNDCIELFLKTSVDDSYIHMTIDAKGRYSVEQRFLKGKIKKRPLNVHPKVMTSINPDSWILEAALPLSDLIPEGRIQTGDFWKINICRQEQPHCEKSSWAPVRASFHRPEYFGRMVFQGEDVPRIKWDAPEILTENENVIRLGLNNLGKKEFDLSFKVLVFDANKKALLGEERKNLTLLPGEEKVEALKFPSIPCENINDLSYVFKAFDSKTDKLLYSSRIFPFKIYNMKKYFAETKSELMRAEAFVAELPDGKIRLKRNREIDAFKQRINNLEKVSNDKTYGIKRLNTELNALNDEILKVSKAVEFNILFLKQSKEKDLSFVAGVSDSLTKITDRSVRDMRISDTVKLNAARNEYESFQLVLFPEGKTSEGVSFEVDDLKKENSDLSIPLENISIYKVGFVEAGNVSYKTDMKGLCPDILTPLKRSSIIDLSHACNPFWITVRIPPETSPGIYRGHLKVCAKDAAFLFKLEVNVWDFSLAKASHLKTAFNLAASWISNFYCGTPRYRETLSPEIYQRFADMLLKYRMQDHFAGIWYSPLQALYGKIPKNYLIRNKDSSFNFSQVIENLRNFKKHGANSFAIAAFPREAHGEKYPEKFKKNISEYLKQYLELLKENGLNDGAYLYLGDEPEPQTYEAIKDASRNICDVVCKGIKKMLVVDKRALGSVKSLIYFIDIWVVHMDIYGGEYADIQKKGKELWFYICSTERPYPAFYIDYPAVDHRIIPWICWKYGAKGFLYWGGNGWHRCGNSAKKMKGNYPDTQNWNPNCNLRNGSSYLIYPAFDANRKPMPLPSLRMEIFRDGMEDYEYLYILKEELKKINNLENPESEKLATEVKEFLDLPSSFLRAADDYSQSSSDFYSMRERAAELIIKCKELVKENRKTNP